MKPVRFGIVGCGAIVTLHQLPALRSCPEVELVAVSDLDGDWAAKVAQRFGIPQSFSDHRMMVDRVEAVLIATPNTTHAEIACTFLERGVHVLCEKPIATTLSDVERMQTTADAHAARLMAAHCLRFSPNLTQLRQVIADGWLGEITEISAGIGGPYEGGAQRTDFRRQRRLSGGGVLIDLGVHVVDLAVWCAGSAPDGVRYLGTSHDGWEVESDAEVSLTFGSKTKASLSASFTQVLENSFTVRGTGGWASASLYDPTQLTLFAGGSRICRRAGLQQVVLPDESMYDRQIAHFCRSVRATTPFLVAPEEARATIGVVERCYAGGGA